MTYSVGGQIQATDFNGFVSDGATNINNIWSGAVASGDTGWGQSALATVSAGSTVSATNWASLVNTLASMGNQTGTTITARSAPTAGTPIAVLSALSTDITNCNTNRANAAVVGTTSTTWTGSVSKTTNTQGSPVTSGGWVISFVSEVTFPSADQARWFWNAGGRVYLNMSKTSTGRDPDSEWNQFAADMPTLNITGNSASKTLVGTAYTGFSITGGNLAGYTVATDTTLGWYGLTAGAAAVTAFSAYPTSGTYSGVDLIYTTLRKSADSTVLTIVTIWTSAARSGPGNTTWITGGTATASPFTAFGTAPTVVCRFVPPSTTYLSNTWGTPTVASSVT